MRRFFILWLILNLPAAAAGGAAEQSSGIQTVYLLPMQGGLDQYLASRLVSARVFHVTVDPSKADALFTDRLDATLAETLDAFWPQVESVAPKHDAERGRSPSFRRAKAAVFLIDPKTRMVLWSFPEYPRNTTPGELHRVAQKIVQALRRVPR